MSTSEPARLALYSRLGEVIGPENAETLMASLPLQPSVELATKQDISELRDEVRDIRSDIRDLRSEIGGFHRALRQQAMFTIGAMTVLTGIFSVIVSLMT